MDIKALESDWFFDDITSRGLSLDGFLPQACKTPLGNIKDFELIHTPEIMAEFQSNSWYEKNPGLAEILLNVSPLESGENVLIEQYKLALGNILSIPCDVHDHDKTIFTRAACRGHEILEKDLSRYFEAAMTVDDEFDEGKLYDVKKEIYRLTDRVVSGLGKCFNVRANEAFEVIDELHKKGVISLFARDNVASASAIALKLRISTYLKARKQGEELKPKSNETPGETAFSYHMPEDEELFHFFYVAIPLYEKLHHLFLHKENFTQLPEEAFFCCDDSIKSSIYSRVLNYTKALECYERALRTDPGNVNMEIRQLRLLLIMNEDTQSIKHKLDCVFEKIFGVPYNTLCENTPNDMQLKAILASLRFTELRQLLEIIMLLSTLRQMDWHLQLAMMIFNYFTTMEDTNMIMKSQIHMIDLALSGFYMTLFKKEDGFDSLITELSSLTESEGIGTKSITCLNKMAELFSSQGTYNKSYNCLQRALTMERTLYGTNLNLNVMKTLHLLGEVSSELAMFAEAEFYLKQVLHQFEAFSGPRQRLIHKQACLLLVGFCSSTNRVEEAMSYLQKGLQLSTDRNLFLEQHFDCMMQCEMAKLLHRPNESGEVMKCLVNAKECLLGYAGTKRNVGMVYYVAMTLHKVGESDEAVMLLEEEIQQLKLDSNETEATYLICLARICNQKHRVIKAEICYGKALEIIISCQNNLDTGDLIECLLELSDVLAGNGKHLEAIRKLQDTKKYIATMKDKRKKCNMLKELGERWELFGEIYFAESCYKEAINLSAERTLKQNFPKIEFILELKLGDLAGKKNFGMRADDYESYVTKEQRTAAQRQHYDRARSLLQHYTCGNIDIFSLENFVLLAGKYAGVDLGEVENILLNALEISNVIYGTASGNDTTSLILFQLFGFYVTKSDFTSAASTIERSVRIEICEHLSDCFHQHICHRLVFLSWISLMNTPTNKDAGQRLVELFLSRLNDKGFTNDSVADKASAAHCFAILSLVFWCYKDFGQAELLNKIGLELFEEIKEQAIPDKRICSKNICYKIKKILEDPTNRIDTLELFQFLTLQIFHENDSWEFLEEKNTWEKKRALSCFQRYFIEKGVDVASFLPKFISILDEYSNDPDDVECKTCLSHSTELLKQFLRQWCGENPVTHAQTLSIDDSIEFLLSAKKIFCSAFSIKGGMSLLNTEARNLVFSGFFNAVKEDIPITHHGAVSDHIVDQDKGSLHEPSSFTTNTENDANSSVSSSLFSAILQSQVEDESDSFPHSIRKIDVEKKEETYFDEHVYGSGSRPLSVETVFSEKNSGSGTQSVLKNNVNSENGQNHVGNYPVHPILVVLEFLIQNLFLRLCEKRADVSRINESKGEKSFVAVQDVTYPFSSTTTKCSEELHGDLSHLQTIEILSVQQPQTSQSMLFENSQQHFGSLENDEATRTMISVIQKLSDSAKNFLEHGEVQKFLDAEENLSSLFKSYVELAPKNMVETFLEIAAESLKTPKTGKVRGSLRAASQFSRTSRQDARLSKLSGDCDLLEDSYRSAAINFSRAEEYYSSNSVQDSAYALEYLETLIGLIKAHILCQHVDDARQVCQRRMAVSSQLQCSSETISYRTMEFYYLSAKCLVSSNVKVTNDELEKAVSFCLQGLVASKTVAKEIKTEDLHAMEILGRNGQLFALKYETQLLLATIQLQLKRQEEAAEILTDMQNFLISVAVDFETLTAATWEGGELEFFKTSSRLFSLIGRTFLMNDQAESAVEWLAKSLSAFASTNQQNVLSLHEELIPLLDSITLSKRSSSADHNNPFQQTIDIYKSCILVKHTDVNTLYESLFVAGYAYLEKQRVSEAIALYEAALTAVECMSNVLGGQRKQGTMHLRLGHAHRLRAITNISKDESVDQSLAKKYYATETNLKKYSLIKKICLAYWLLEESEFAEASVILEELLKLKDLFPDVFVNLKYTSRHFYGPDVRTYIEKNGECTSTIACLVYSLAVFVYVGVGMTKEAILACDELSTQRDFEGAFSTRPLLTTHLTVACHRKLLSLANDRNLRYCDLPLSPINLARLYYELKEYEHVLKYCTGIIRSVGSPLNVSPDQIPLQLTSLLISCNILVKMGNYDACYSLFTLFLNILKYEEEILDENFNKLSALLDECSPADHFYLLRVLAFLCATRGNLSATMKCYEKCLEENENLESRQEIVMSLAELYQSKAMLAKDDKETYAYWMTLAHNLYARFHQNVAKITPFIEFSYASFLCKIDRHREAVDHLQNVIHQSTEDSILSFADEDKPLLDACLSREIEVRGSLTLPLKVVAYYQLSSAYLNTNEIEKAQESARLLENYVANLQSSQDYPLYLSVVGYTYKLIRNRQKAFSVFVSVLEKLPEHLPVIEAQLSLSSL